MTDLNILCQALMQLGPFSFAKPEAWAIKSLAEPSTTSEPVHMTQTFSLAYWQWCQWCLFPLSCVSEIASQSQQACVTLCGTYQVNLDQCTSFYVRYRMGLYLNHLVVLQWHDALNSWEVQGVNSSDPLNFLGQSYISSLGLAQCAWVLVPIILEVPHGE